MGTYLITGATGGVGTAVAELLRGRGHDLVLTGRSADRLDELTTALRSGAHASTQVFSPSETALSSPGAAITTIALDLAEPRRLEASLASTRPPGRLDGLIHAAGTVRLSPVADLDVDTWQEHLSTNLVSAAELTRLLLPALRAAEGHVVFVNSTGGLQARPNWSAYAASKYGMRALADALRAEEPALRVTTVFPGRTATKMQQRVRAQEGRPYDAGDYADPATVARVLVAALETPRDAVVSEVTVRPR